MSKNKISKSFLQGSGKIPVIASLIVLIAFIAGLFAGTLVVAKSISGIKLASIVKMTGSFADGYNAAKKKLLDSGIIPPRQQGILSGQITDISGNNITFTAPLANPLDDESLKTRTAVVANDTTITLYRQKSVEQMAQDQAAGQKAMTDLQGQISSLRIEMSKCQAPTASSSAKSGDACATLSNEYADAIQKQNQINQQMSPFAKVDNATLSDLKAGMQITVYGEKIDQTGNKPMANPANFADISGSLKFNVSAIDAREVPAPATPSAPAVAPSVPAK
jgi:hypothetical protein